MITLWDIEKRNAGNGLLRLPLDLGTKRKVRPFSEWRDSCRARCPANYCIYIWLYIQKKTLLLACCPGNVLICPCLCVTKKNFVKYVPCIVGVRRSDRAYRWLSEHSNRDPWQPTTHRTPFLPCRSRASAQRTNAFGYFLEKNKIHRSFIQLTVSGRMPIDWTISS